MSVPLYKALVTVYTLMVGCLITGCTVRPLVSTALPSSSRMRGMGLLGIIVLVVTSTPGNMKYGNMKYGNMKYVQEINESTKVHNPRRNQSTAEIWRTSRFGSKVACYVERYPR